MNNESQDFGLDIEKVLNSRLIELNSLSKEIKMKSNKLILQRLPRYMRRRAASHNPKRLPNKYIKYPLTTVGNSLLKDKRRRQRKKHVSKLKKKLSILKRNKKEGRTTLHIWFRKRFSLINELNYLVPLRNNTKNFRNLHKVSIKQCAFYYRPLIKILEIKFENNQSLKEALVLMKSLFNSSLDESCKRELDLFFHKNNSCLVPVSVLQSSDQFTIWLSVPTDHFSLINQTLNKLFSNTNLKSIIYECQFERFRLIGPKSTKYLEVLLNTSSSFNQNENIDLNHLFKSNQMFILSSKFFGEKVNLKILLKDKIRSIIDVLVPKNQVRKFWYNLVKNRGHLVGGKADYEYYALQNDFICYPSIGFLSEQKNNLKFKLLKSILEQLDNESNELTNENLNIIRSTELLKLCVSPFDNLDKINDLYDKGSLVNVKLQTIRKGTIEENDLIYLPTDQDLIQLNEMLKMSREERFVNQLTNDSPVEKTKLKKLKLNEQVYSNKEELKLVLERSSRKVIGVIEIGKFSLKSGKSEAFGTICTKFLLELINLHANCDLKKNLNVLIRSANNCKFRFCSMRVRKFEFF